MTPIGHATSRLRSTASPKCCWRRSCCCRRHGRISRATYRHKFASICTRIGWCWSAAARSTISIHQNPHTQSNIPAILAWTWAWIGSRCAGCGGGCSVAVRARSRCSGRCGRCACFTWTDCRGGGCASRGCRGCSCCGSVRAIILVNLPSNPIIRDPLDRKSVV